MAQLICENADLGYNGAAVVTGLDLKIEKGQYICILGENGSGKSTFVKTLLGLIPPVSGKIVTGDGLKKTNIGYLPQQTAVQKDFPASVREVVLSGCCSKLGLRPFYGKAERKRAEYNIERLGIKELKKRCYRELSGGQQQRVLLARALCATESMLLLDEPVSGLDPKGTAQMYGIIDELNKKDGITVIMITHDVEAALKYADHILHIGHTVFYGTVEEYKKSRFAADLTSRDQENGGLG